MKITEVEKLLSKAAQKYVTKAEADYFAKAEIDNHLKKSYRYNTLNEAVQDIEKWQQLPDQKIETQVNKKSLLLLNFNGLAPSLKLKYLHDELEKRAKANGISAIGINKPGGLDSLNLYTDWLSKRGLLSFCAVNGGPDSVVPYGGTQGIFGTNPFSYSIPTLEEPAIADFATSEIPYFEIKGAKKRNEALKSNSAVDSNGEVTTDASKALSDKGIANILPMGGGYKGYLMVYLVEILGGPLVRSLLSTEMSDKYVNVEHGALIVAFDISSFTNLKKFKSSISEMNKIIRSQKPKKGLDRIRIPGDHSYLEKEENLKKGEVELNSETLEKLKTLAA